VVEVKRTLRKRRRFLVEFESERTTHTGFTHDVSASGLFVCTIHLATPGTLLRMSLHPSKDRSIRLTGVVVRSVRGPAGLVRLMPSGFAVRFSNAPADYLEFLATL